MESSRGRFYITSPIYYINDKPHIGHAYTTFVADTLARWRAARGEEVLFLTGTDENSQKTVDAAKKRGEEVREYTDRMAEEWARVWSKLGIMNTDFIRTTEERHIEVVNDFWGRLDAAGDFYKDSYEGLYCKGHEAFLREDELVDGLCPEHKTKPELVSEENYFFRLSKYQKQLLELYDAHGDFVAPAHRFNEVRSFVERGLEDVSFSREKREREWGIPVPNDPHQVIYVWADALVNYISAVGMEGWDEHPADIHAVGKDILRFHAVIWPAMLMSAGMPLPGQVIANGFLTVGGTKMGKSLGNAVDPLELAERYGVDGLRYFLLREIPYGEDGDFSEEKMRERYNADLANGLGNFAARVLTLAEKESFAWNMKLDTDFEKHISVMNKEIHGHIQEFKFPAALAAIWFAISFGDRYVNEKKVWEIKDAAPRAQALFNLASLLEAIAASLTPFLPSTAAKISAAFTHEGNALRAKKIDALFPRIK
ncbi:MAG TPA: class I tRNA ligase family protein [Candidatus Paceibacterota bacterium]|jgi:methionyl-tRNA synthetase|nr:class I tRNA ligase family protein [Candidatus Paceibacterota bacterium]